MKISDTVALVTGANRGLGLAIARALAESGAKVYAASRSKLVEIGPNGVALKLDVTDEASIAEAVKAAGDVTLLINNAGVLAGGGPSTAQTMDGARKEIETNYFGSLAMARAFAPVIKGNGGGAIVNVASILAHAPIPQVGTYSASKAAVLSMTQSLRAELAASGIRVFGLLPAFVDTDMTAQVKQDKMTPEQVCSALIEHLESGAVNDIYPGPAAQMAAGFHSNPAGYERQLAGALS